MKIGEIIRGSRSFKIGYLGGSITEGSGASSPEKCFRRKFTEYIKGKYPQTEIEEINAAIGGTGSDLGLFRMQRDLLSKKPDMVFIEFAVNDYGLSDTDIYVENIIRNILSYNENTVIVLLYTSTLNMFNNDYSNGKTAQSVVKQQRVADYYNIPALDMGKVLLNKLASGEVNDKDIWIDGVHPNDYGYSLYEDFLEKHVEELDVRIDFKKESLKDRLYPNAAMVLTEGMSNEEWKLSYASMYNRLPNYIYSEKAGTKLDFEFEGSIIGVYHTIEKDSGNFAYSVDDGTEKICSTWDKYALSFGRACYSILESGLSFGKHTLSIRILAEHEEKSEGNFVRIGAFLVG